MITKKINVKLNDWKLKFEPIYYSRRKRAWYCIECKLYTESPRSIALHADEHDIKLPNSRPQANMHKINQNENLSSNVEDFSYVKSLDEEIEEINANSFPSMITLTKESMNPFYVAMRTGETFDSVIGTYRDGKWYPKPQFRDPVEGKKERIWQRLMSIGEQLKKKRCSGLYSEQALMEEKIIFLFLLRQEEGFETHSDLKSYVLQ